MEKNDLPAALDDLGIAVAVAVAVAGVRYVMWSRKQIVDPKLQSSRWNSKVEARGVFVATETVLWRLPPLAL